MQEHVELEVSLEIIMSEIANKMLEKNVKDFNSSQCNELEKLILLQEKAYMGDRDSVLKILKREF